MIRELVESAVRGQGDLSGVFEYDGDTASLYLFDLNQKSQQIIDVIHMFSGTTDLRDSDVIPQWDIGEQRVGPFLRGVQWAVCNIASKRKHGATIKRKINLRFQRKKSSIA